MTPNHINDPQHWYDRAAEMRALAETMAVLADDPTGLRALGMAALSRVRGITHRTMHAERSRIIARHLG